MTSLQWFGVRWNAPIMEEAPEIPVPVGYRCLYCEEVITTDESGVTMPSIEAAGTTRRPIHIECFLRSTLGSVAHQEQRCTCFGGTAEDSDDRSYREQARELMSWLIEHSR